MHIKLHNLTRFYPTNIMNNKENFQRVSLSQTSKSTRLKRDTAITISRKRKFLDSEKEILVPFGLNQEIRK